jgi:hypothetical protein
MDVEHESFRRRRRSSPRWTDQRQNKNDARMKLD